MSKPQKHQPGALRPHHQKPYRRRHLALLLLSLICVVTVAFEIGLVIGHDQRATAPVPVPPENSATNLTTVSSVYGYSFEADAARFTIATTDHSATVRPKAGTVSGRIAAAQFSVEVNPDAAQLTTLRQQTMSSDLSAQQVAARLFPVTSSSELAVKTVSAAASTLNAVPVYKTVYEFTSQPAGGKSYAIQWTGVSHGRAFAVTLTGLIGGANIPVVFTPIMDSLNLVTDQAVLGASTSPFAVSSASAHSKLDAKYLSDALSPAVVEIFHTVCGVLTIDNQRLGDSDCISFTGSGFLTTSDGYIATNGHVVQYGAKDAVANLVATDENVQRSYLKGLGLSDAQSAIARSDPATMAALVSKIYDYPDDMLKFSDKGELTMVALGSDQPDIKQLLGLKNSLQLAKFRHDSNTIKQARLIGSNYAAKDSFTTIADPANGFSSSDVALLKINVQKAPTIPISTDKVVQNQKIILMGFPGDAGNPLVDNTVNDVTVTDGVVSAIRQAAGGKGKLYQSDADASHGNSGGPAIDDQGRVIGLLTYRYANPEAGNAAKSYIRDITDFTDLAKAYNVTIDNHSTTQDAWMKGLELYSHDHYSAALKNFMAVQAAYPAHRLVAAYITSTKEAIAAGKDVRNLPVDSLVAILVGALILMGSAILLMVRHHGLHKVYQLSTARTSLLSDTPNPATPKISRLVQ